MQCPKGIAVPLKLRRRSLLLRRYFWKVESQKLRKLNTKVETEGDSWVFLKTVLLSNPIFITFKSFENQEVFYSIPELLGIYK